MIPTPRAAALLAIGLLPAALAGLHPAFAVVAMVADVVIATLICVDFVRAPRPSDLEVRRVTERVISAHQPNRIRLLLSTRGRPVRGEVKDAPPLDAEAVNYAFRFNLPGFGEAAFQYLLTPTRRGEMRFGDITLRISGPWGLAWRQTNRGGASEVKAYPDLAALERDAALMGRPDVETALTALRRSLGEGREFESLRDYVAGDDQRTIDWKATAKRGRPITRHYEPERNQTVMLLLDCGRHMVSRVGDRTKLDFAVDAALRVARISVDRGDLAGLCVFGTQVQSYLPPRKGRDALRGLVDALYRASPELLESDYAAAFDVVAARNKKRSLVVVFSDLLDEEASRILVARATRLRPRHLPLVVAVADNDLVEAARKIPTTPDEAYVRVAAQRLWKERESTAAHLRDAGALVVSVPARALTAAVVNQYLEVKAKGLL